MANKQMNGKKNMPTWVGTLIVVAVLVLLVVFSVFCILNARGTFLRMRKVAKTENYEITVPMMKYLIYSERNERVEQREQQLQYFASLGVDTSKINFPISGGEGGSALDTSKPLTSQIYSSVKNESGATVETTWFEHFAGLARTKAEKILVLCEAAHDANVSLTDEEKENIKAQLAALETSVSLYGYTLDGYLAMQYGNGVSSTDVRAMMELSELAAKYGNQRLQGFTDAVTDERVNGEYTENRSEYDIYMGVIGYTFTATFTPSTDKDEEKAAEENRTNLEKYENEQKKYAERAEALLAATTKDEFSTRLREYLYTDNFEAEKEKALAKKENGEELTDAEIAECSKLAETATNTALKRADIADLAEDSSSYSIDDDVMKWIFESEKKDEKTVYLRALGDNKKWEDVHGAVKTEEADPAEPSDETEENEAPEATDETEETEDSAPEARDAEAAKVSYEKATSTYTVYLITDPIHRSTGLSVAHILLKADTFKDLTSTSKLSGDVKALADEVLARDGKVTAEAMANALLDKMLKDGVIEEKTDAEGKKWYAADEHKFSEYAATYTGDSNVSYDNVIPGQMVEPFENWLYDLSRKEGEVSYPKAVTTEYGEHIMLYLGKSWYVTIRNSLAEKDYNDYCDGLLEKNPPAFNEKNWNYLAK